MDSKEFVQMRNKMRLTQKELSERLDVSENSIYRWETGRTAIPQTVVLAMKQIRRELLEEDMADQNNV